MIDERGNVHTAHTTEQVDFIVFDPEDPGIELREGGRLADVAPTVLRYMAIEPPVQMDGQNLVAS